MLPQGGSLHRADKIECVINTTSVSVSFLGRKIGSIEIKQEGSLTIPSLERRFVGVRENLEVDPDLIKPIARKAVAYLEPFASNRVQSDPTFDDAFASGYDLDMALEALIRKKFTQKGVAQMTYQFLLLGPLSEQKEMASIFKGAIKNVIENHWPTETSFSLS